MPRMMLTNAAVKRLKAPASGRIEYWDALLPGLGIRISETGRRTWVLMTRLLNGTLIRLTIGTYPAVSLKDARKKARDHMRVIKRGEDPRIERRERKSPNVVEDVVADFLKRHVEANLRPRSAQEVRRTFDQYVIPRWRGRAIKAAAPARVWK